MRSGNTKWLVRFKATRADIARRSSACCAVLLLSFYFVAVGAADARGAEADPDSDEDRPALRIEAWKGSPFQDDVFRQVSPAVRGKVVYASTLFAKVEGPRSFVLLRDLDSPDGAGGGRQPEAFAITRSSGKAHSPQFSPDGKYVLWRVGDPFHSWSTYDLYLWDIVGSTVRKIDHGDDLAYRYIRWTADSKRIAFVSGGDRFGAVEREIDRLGLYVYDVAKQKSTLVCSNPGVVDFAWMPSGELLYCAFPGPDKSRPLENKILRAPLIRREEVSPVTIFEWRGPGEASVPLIGGGFKPSPSRTGHEIAFLGWEPPQVQKGTSASPALFTYSLKDHKRTLVTKKWVGNAVWAMHDSKLLYCRTDYRVDHKEGLGTGTVLGVSLSDPALKEVPIGEIKIRDSAPMDRSSATPQFELEASDSDRQVYVRTSQYLDLQGNHYTDVQGLSAVDVPTGKVQEMFSVTSYGGACVGFGWHEGGTRNTLRDVGRPAHH